MQWVYTILKVIYSDFIIFPLDFLLEREKKCSGYAEYDSFGSKSLIDTNTNKSHHCKLSTVRIGKK